MSQCPRTATPGEVVLAAMETSATPNTLGCASPRLSTKKHSGSSSPDKITNEIVNIHGSASPHSEKKPGFACPAPISAPIFTPSTSTTVFGTPAPPVLSRRLQKALRKRDRRLQKSDRPDPTPSEPYASFVKRRRLHRHFPAPSPGTFFAAVTASRSLGNITTVSLESLEDFPVLEKIASPSSKAKTVEHSFPRGLFIQRPSQSKRKKALQMTNTESATEDASTKDKTDSMVSGSPRKRYHLSISSLSSTASLLSPAAVSDDLRTATAPTDSEADVYNSEDENYAVMFNGDRMVNPDGDLFIRGRRRPLRRIPVEHLLTEAPLTQKRLLCHLIKLMRSGVNLAVFWRTATRLATTVSRDNFEREQFMRVVAKISHQDSRLFLKLNKLCDTDANLMAFNRMFHRHGWDRYGEVSSNWSRDTSVPSDMTNLLLEDKSVSALNIANPKVPYQPTSEDLHTSRAGIVSEWTGSGESLFAVDTRWHMQEGTVDVNMILGEETPPRNPPQEEAPEDVNPSAHGFSIFDNQSETSSDKFAFIDAFMAENGSPDSSYASQLVAHFKNASHRKRSSSEEFSGTDSKRSRISNDDISFPKNGNHDRTDSTNTVPCSPHPSCEAILAMENLLDLDDPQGQGPILHFPDSQRLDVPVASPSARSLSPDEPAEDINAMDEPPLPSASSPSISTSAHTARSASSGLMTARQTSPSPGDLQLAEVDVLLCKIDVAFSHILRLKIAPHSILDSQRALGRQRTTCHRLRKEISATGALDQTKIDRCRRLIDQAADRVLAN